MKILLKIIKIISMIIIHLVVGEKQISRYVLRDEIRFLEKQIKAQKAVIEKQRFMLWHYESEIQYRKA